MYNNYYMYIHVTIGANYYHYYIFGHLLSRSYYLIHINLQIRLTLRVLIFHVFALHKAHRLSHIIHPDTLHTIGMR